MRSKIWKATRKALASDYSDLLEVGGLIGVAVAVGHLAGFWWGVLAGSMLAVAYSMLAPDASLPSGDA